MCFSCVCVCVIALLLCVCVHRVPRAVCRLVVDGPRMGAFVHALEDEFKVRPTLQERQGRCTAVLPEDGMTACAVQDVRISALSSVVQLGVPSRVFAAASLPFLVSSLFCWPPASPSLPSHLTFSSPGEVRWTC